MSKPGESSNFSAHKLMQTKGESSLQDTANTYNDPSLCPVLFTQTHFEEDGREIKKQFQPPLALLILFPPHEILAVEGRRPCKFTSIEEFPDVLFQFAECPCTRNTTGLMQGPHRSCVQGKKAKINTARHIHNCAERNRGACQTTRPITSCLWQS